MEHNENPLLRQIFEHYNKKIVFFIKCQSFLSLASFPSLLIIQFDGK